MRWINLTRGKKMAAMCSESGCVVLPGDVIQNLKESETSGKIILGPGLRREVDSVMSYRPGILTHKEPNVYWIDSHHKRYVPVRGENVIGIVISKAGDVFKVDVGSSEPASLSYLAFEGATKRNRPDVKIGDLLYGKFLVANKDMEPELVCIDSLGRSSGLGVIGRDEGFMFGTSLNLTRKLLSQSCVALKTIGNSLPFEVAVGMNGRIWVKGRSVKETIAISNMLSNSEFMDNEEIKLMVNQTTNSLAGFS